MVEKGKADITHYSTILINEHPNIVTNNLNEGYFFYQIK